MAESGEARESAPQQISAERMVHIGQQNIEGGATIVLGGAAEPRIPVHKPPRNLPPRDERFAGREAELAELHGELNAASQVGITQQHAVHGHGGIGKTSTAIEYAWRHLDDYPGGVFYLACDSELPPAVSSLAPHLGLALSERSEEIAARVKQHLETGEPCLLVLDNVDGPEQWRNPPWNRYLPAGACRRLITTRAEHLADVKMYRLDRLDGDAGVALLAGFRPDAAGDADARRVVEWFDGLAVGLTVAGAYMQDNPDLSWKRYAHSLDEKGLDTVRRTEDAVAAQRTYERRVDSVFDDLVDSLPPAERRALEYAALLPEDEIYRDWLPAFLSADEQVEVPEPPGREGEGASRVVAKLIERRLLRELRDEGAVLGLHRVLRHRLYERLSKENGQAALVESICKLARSRGVASHGWVEDRRVRVELKPLAALSRELAKSGQTKAAATLGNRITTPMRQLGRFAEQRAVLEPLASEPNLTLIGQIESARLLSNLAMILKDMGELRESRERMERAIEIDEQNFDPNHPTLATRYSNFATILQDMGELRESRERMERAIKIDEQNFDPNHPTLATRYSNLATILLDMGELRDARERMERAIEIEERSFDPNHPSLARSYSNLAMIRFKEGDRGVACALLRRAEEILREYFSADHPNYQIVLRNIAVVRDSAD
jgi:Tfp pilus assembly protein PilF